MHKISFAIATLGVAVSLASRSADAQTPAAGTPAAPASTASAPAATAAPAAASAAPPPAAASPAAAPPPPATAPAPSGLDTPPPPASDPLPAEDPEAVWAARDRAVTESSTLTGGVGLLHMQHAQGNAAGQFNISFTTEYFSANFLCTPSFPCSNPNGGANLTSDTMNHFGGSLQLSATILNWLEVYGGTSAYANSDNANKPSLLQVLGDTDIGFKAFGQVAKAIHVGGGAELWLINGTGSVGLDGSGTSAKFRALATADLRETDAKTPLRFSLNTTYSLDNTGQVIAATEAARGAPITRIERYGLGINRVDHFDIGIGAEAFFVDERIRPFVEYNILIPINRQGYACLQVNASGDNCLKKDKLAPSKLTLGGRFLPWKRGFAVTAAFDIGITGMNDFIQELSPVPPWTFYIGVGWGIDTQERPAKVETTIVQKEVNVGPLEGHIKGYVHEDGKPENSIPNAIVAFANHPEITSLATGADGHFVTLGLPAAKYDFTVKADGYRDGVCTATLAESQPAAPPAAPPAPDGTPAAPAPAAPAAPSDGKTTIPDVSVNCLLVSLPRVGKVVGHVRDADTKSPVGNVNIKLADAGGHEFTQVSDANGAFHFDGLAPASYTLTASSEEYMNGTETVDVKPRQEASVEVTLVHRPKNPLVSISQKEIIIRQQVQFATDSAVILPASTALLTEVADAFARNPRIRGVEIQGHTDSDGDDAHNQMLSEDRANAVRSWLIAHGVASDRLTAKGYGEKKPLVPNVTAGNRARNRRVQFIITDQDAAAPKGGH